MKVAANIKNSIRLIVLHNMLKCVTLVPFTYDDIMTPKQYILVIAVTVIALIAGCVMMMDNPKTDPVVPDVDPDEYVLKISGPGGTLYADLADTDAAKGLIDALEKSSLNVSLQDYGGFEKVGDLGIRLTRSDVDMDTGPGDIVLYNGKSIVMFYGSNSWDYTSLAKIPDTTADAMREFLGSGDITLNLSIAKR